MQYNKSTVTARKFDSFVNLPTTREGGPRLEGVVSFSRRPHGAKGVTAVKVAESEALIWSSLEWSTMAASAAGAEGEGWLAANKAAIDADPELAALRDAILGWRADGELSAILKLTAAGKPLFQAATSTEAAAATGMFVPGRTRAQPAPRGSYSRPQASENGGLTAEDLGV